MKTITFSNALLALLPLSLAQFPPIPSGLTSVASKVNSSVKIRYKETQICERTKGVKSYSGYVHLPGSLLANVGGFDINTYFLYVEARNNASTAPLGLYFAGGPGESSIYTALASESGPCYVNVAGNDTTINPWSFNNDVNMLWIDQPVQAGFSYDRLVNGTFNLTEQIITPLEYDAKTAAASTDPFTSWGTFPSQDAAGTTNTSVSSARAVWHFGEHWLSSFPEYSTSSNKITFWGNSAGGYWVPETAARFSKNLETLPARHPLKTKNIQVDSIGITNGCIDFETGLAGFPQYAFNNTYGVRFLNKDQYNMAMENLTSPGGVLDLVRECRALGLAGDPTFLGNNATVNEACMTAFGEAYAVIFASEALNNRSAFDIAVHQPDPCPFDLGVIEYLNRPDVQQALGVPLNFTYDSTLISAVFGTPTAYTLPGTGDLARQNGLPNIEYLLSQGVKVALVYGDRDYRCPWTGAEATAKAAKWTHQDGFASAGYTKIQGIASGRQGLVKQYGLMSFSRVFDAGHSVNAYAPEAVYRIFKRTVLGHDVATGTKPAVNVGHHTTGPAESWGSRNTLPADVPHTCMVEGDWTKSNPWDAIFGPQ